MGRGHPYKVLHFEKQKKMNSTINVIDSENGKCSQYSTTDQKY